MTATLKEWKRVLSPVNTENSKLVVISPEGHLEKHRNKVIKSDLKERKISKDLVLV